MRLIFTMGWFHGTDGMWYTGNIYDGVVSKRQCHAICGLPWKDACQTPGSITTAAISTFCSTNKQLFAVSDELLDKAKTISLPSNIPVANLPQRFCDFFVTKIKRIRENLDSCPHDPPSCFLSSMDVSYPCLNQWQKSWFVDSFLSHQRKVAPLTPSHYHD